MTGQSHLDKKTGDPPNDADKNANQQATNNQTDLENEEDPYMNWTNKTTDESTSKGDDKIKKIVETKIVDKPDASTRASDNNGQKSHDTTNVADTIGSIVPENEEEQKHSIKSENGQSVKELEVNQDSIDDNEVEDDEEEEYENVIVLGETSTHRKSNGPRKSKNKRKQKRDKKSSKITQVDANENQIDKANDKNTKIINADDHELVDLFKIRFHVFISPEYNIDFGRCNIGIFCEALNWEEAQMISLEPIRKFHGGHIASGEIKFKRKPNNRVDDFWYKYLIKIPFDDEDEYLVEYLSHSQNRLINLSNFKQGTTYDRYDGIMLPPDQANTSSGKWKNLLKTAYNKIFTFFDENLYKKHLTTTIEAMLYEIRPSSQTQTIKTMSLRDTLRYFDRIFNNLNSFYNRHKQSLTDDLRKKFFEVLINILANQRELNFVNSFCVLYVFAHNCAYRLKYLDNLYPMLLKALLVDENFNFQEIFDTNGDSSYKKEINLKYLKEMYDYVVEMPESLNLLKVIIFLTYGYVDVDFLTSNHVSEYLKIFYCNCTRTDDFLRKHFNFFKNNLGQSSVLELLPYLPHYLVNDPIHVKELMSVFKVEHCLEYLLVCLRESSNYYWAQQYYVKNLNEKGKIKLIVALEISIQNFIEEKEKPLPRVLSIQAISSQIIESQLDKLLYFFNNSNKGFEVQTLFFVLKINFYSSKLMKNFNSQSHISLSFEQNRALYEPILKSLQRNCDYLRVFNYQIEEGKLGIFMIWSDFFDVIDYADESFKPSLRKFVDQYCLNSLKSLKVNNLINLCKIIMKKEEIYNPLVEKLTFDAIKHKVDEFGMNDLNYLMSLDNNNDLLNSLADEIIDRKWPVKDNEISIFSFIFECYNFLKLFLDEKIQNYQQDKFHIKIVQIIEQLDGTLMNLVTGNVKIFLLKMFIDNLEKLICLYQLFKHQLSNKPWKEDYNETISTYVNNLVKLRFIEVENFGKFHAFMKRFHKFIYSYPIIASKVDLEQFTQTIQSREKIDDFDLIALTDPLLLEHYETIKNYPNVSSYLNERIKCFNVKPSEYAFIYQLVKLSNERTNQPPGNIILFDIIRENSNRLHLKLDVSNFIDRVLKPAYQEYKNLMNELNSGSLSFEKFETLIRILPNLNIRPAINVEWKDLFRTVMKLAEFDQALVDKRIRQCELYLKLKNVHKIISVLIEIKEKNALEKDYQPLKDLYESNVTDASKNKKIKDIDEKSAQMFMKLEKFNDEGYVKCLTKYIENYDFIEWMRTNLPTLESVRVFSEMASEYENEGALEMIKAQSLSLVGDLYAPLIYDLKKDTFYDDFIKFITKVYENFKKNKNMGDRLEKIAKERAWLEEIKEAKGNTEANSLKQAERINSTGIYSVGCNNIAKNYNLTLDDLVKLRVPAKEKLEERSYNYSELIELNDKLTLVVGKDEHQQTIIRYFSDVLEGIIGIANGYLALMRTGNILFRNWNATIFCDQNHKLTIKVNFGLREDNQNVVGERNTEKTTADSIIKTSKFLEKCYAGGIEHLNERRRQMSELNYYKISELTLLRTRLAQFIVNSKQPGTASNLNKRELFDMLFYVNRDVDDVMLMKANEYAFIQSREELKSRPKQARKAQQPDDAQEEHDQQHQEMDENKQKLFDRLKDMNINESTILKAFQNCPTADFDQLMDYCFTYVEPDVDPQLAADAATRRFINSEQNFLNFDQIKQEQIFDMDEEHVTLEKTYEKIWQKFVTYLDRDFDDFISLNHLGKMLIYLKSNSTLTIQRRKPDYLDQNIPNLIVCPKDDVIRRVLGVYAVSADQPLPTDDEILFCNEQTTFEELELFWNRVFFSKSEGDQKLQKIYSLVNVQDLPYDQAVKALSKFEKIQSNLNQVNPHFNLVVFCSIEKEDKSVFATAFNRYRKNVPLDNGLDAKLRDYLRANVQLNGKFKNSLAKVEKDGLNVRVVTSERAGVGKSLYVQRLVENAHSNVDRQIPYCCIPIKRQTLPFESVFNALKSFTDENRAASELPKIYHIDIAYEVWYEVDYFLFNLICLGILKHKNGEMFRRGENDLFLIEIMTPKFNAKNDDDTLLPLHSILTILPTLKCLTPTQVFEQLKEAQVKPLADDICPVLFDAIHLQSELIQRPCQYLQINDTKNTFENFRYSPQQNLDARTCLELLLKHLENKNPNWSEIIYFVSFLNSQLIDCENSVFCSEANNDMLPGFKTFVVKFMIQMSHDFALPSLDISDCSALRINESNTVKFELDQLKMRRKWENDPHPYLFFNPDGQTFTFFGFHVNRRTGQLIDSNTQRPLFDDKLKLSMDLMNAIDSQEPDASKRVLNENITKLDKDKKIRKLLNVMGVNQSLNVDDPDSSYELTMDNLLKMIAIYMRFRANIPVIIMGETGCGKTRLCRYLCDLLKNLRKNRNEQVKNMHLVKVHGGVTADDIKKEVEKAQKLAIQNWQNSPGMYTILFFDEANSTEAIGTIKEIMCDMRIDGRRLDTNSGLKIIAACNPYKKHSDEIIKGFEQSGLGFYIDMNETQEKLGDLPMRHLVYRVQPLPASMLPIIWDFGQLGNDVEGMYIRQIVLEKFKNSKLDLKYIDLLTAVLSASQKFMKNLKNECSFVSLRDIQRVLRVFNWFMSKGDVIFELIKNKSKKDDDSDSVKSVEKKLKPSLTSLMTQSTIDKISNSSDDEKDEDEDDRINLEDENEIDNKSIAGDSLADLNIENDELVLNSIILALNACYHVGLQSEQTRLEYRNEILRLLRSSFKVDQNEIVEVINNCYEVFLDEISLPDAIARNQALKENIFMMLICVELKIPLFIIGKPGSSKTLAKTLITLKMQGSDRLNSKVLKKFKEAQLITFQCSPLSTSDMILKTFRNCAKYQLQRRDDLNRYASAVVLDEIGLAEASSSMPLKILHPLLEDGVFFEEAEEKILIDKIGKKKKSGTPTEISISTADLNEDWHKVGFIGISNWVLDPAKMNRGIFVNRNSPSVDELKETVIGICKNDDKVLLSLESMHLIDKLSKAYLELCEKAKSKTREFFGLRDFYSLIKMIYWRLKDNNVDGERLEWQFLEKCIRRNFGGLIDIDPVAPFIIQFRKDKNQLALRAGEEKSKINVIDLIKEALLKKTTEDESRYLLLLSQNDNALDLINNFVLNEFDQQANDEPPDTESKRQSIKIIFGSSFPNDQRYSEICRKIHQIKLSMELGKTVVLLNLENLYESLYDALNQFYYKLNENEKYVDLGLGTARVKCLVHNDFRLIIVADKKSVYNPRKYPIPLVNRLEKHLLSIESILNDKMKQIDESVKKWVNQLTDISSKYGLTRANEKNKLKPSDIFIGLNDETVASLVFKISKDLYAAQMASDEYELDWLDCVRQIERQVKNQLIQSSTSDGIIRLLQLIIEKKPEADLGVGDVIDTYYTHQTHDNLTDFVRMNCFNENFGQNRFMQITTHSKLVYKKDVELLKNRIVDDLHVETSSLLTYNTQQQFVEDVRKFFELAHVNHAAQKKQILIIQCECGHLYQELITCARFTIIDEFGKLDANVQLAPFHIILIIQIPKIAGGCLSGFQTSKWFCYHIDDLQDYVLFGNILKYKDKSLSEIFSSSLDNDHYYQLLVNLLQSVIYNACAKIVDEKIKDRSVTRIQIVLYLLKRKPNFTRTLLKHLARLQTEREKLLQTEQRSRMWLFNEVSKISSVIKYGTLKSSCINYMETRLCSLLSGLLALIDVNRNLDILFNVQNEKHWLSDLWMYIFDNENLLDLTYANNYLLANNIEKNEYPCAHSYLLYKSDYRLKLKLPFSWIIKDCLDKLINLTVRDVNLSPSQQRADEANMEQFEQIKNAYAESEIKLKLGEFFKSMELKERVIAINQLKSLFLNDYLMLSTGQSFINEDHLKLVSKRVNNYLEFKLKVSQDFISIAYAVKLLKKEINLFHKFVDHSPNIIGILVKSDNQNQNMCFLAARLAINTLGQVNPQMKKEKWEEWFGRVKSAGQLIDTLLVTFRIDEISNNADDIDAFKSLWQRVQMTSYFIENICGSNPELYERCITLWNYFEKEEKIDMKSSESFEKLIKILSLISKPVNTILKKDALVCAGCNSCEFDALYLVQSCENSCLICENCTDDTRNTKRCAKCTRPLPGGQIRFTKSQDSNTFNKKLRKFKANLNGFVMDVVTNLCFDKMYESLPDDKVIDRIVTLLLPKGKETQVEGQPATIDLSLSPSIKSTLFQFLINYSPAHVEAHLNNILQRSSQYLQSKYKVDDLTNLKMMYINCVEDNLLSGSEHNTEPAVVVQNLIDRLRDTRQMINDIENQKVAEIKKLNTIANIRYCLVSFSKMVLSLKVDDQLSNELIQRTKNLIESMSQCVQLQYFLIKNIFRRYGQSEFNNLVQVDAFKWILPKQANGNDSELEVLADNYLVLGDDYKDIRELIKDSLATDNYQKLNTHMETRKNKTLPCLLVLYKELSLCDDLLKNQSEKCKTLIETLSNICGPNYKALFDSLSDQKQLGELFNQRNKNKHISMLLMHFKVVFGETRPLFLLNTFKQLKQNPAAFERAYLPSIPHDQDFEIVQIFKQLSHDQKQNHRFYKCRNNHIYAIGDCTKPEAQSICPTCKEKIGAVASHQLLADNSPVENIEAKIEHGYLSDAQLSNIRNMGILNTHILRIFLDCTLYLSSLLKPDQVLRLINDDQKPNVNEVSDYFYQKLNSNLLRIGTYLQNSPEEILLLIHFILDELYVKAANNHQANALTSKENRDAFEKEFTKFVNDLINQNTNVENLINKYTNIVTQDARNNGSNLLFKISYDLLDPVSGNENNLGEVEFLNQKEFWTFRKQITFNVFINSFKTFYGNQTGEQRARFDLLNRFIDDLDRLKTIKYLPSLLKMVKVLHSVLNRQIDKHTAANLKLGELMARDQTLANSREIIERGAADFLKLWSRLGEDIRTKSKLLNRFGSKSDKFINDFSLLPVSFLLPNNHGDGIYIYALIAYQISLQNDFLKFYCGCTTDAESIKKNTLSSVEWENLTVSECIDVSIKQNLQKIVFSNSNYTLEHVKELNLNFDFNEIQECVKVRYLNEKMLINASNLPLIQFSDSFNDLSRFSLLKRRIPQNELSFAIKEKISLFYRAPNQLNDIIRKLHIIIDFIISSGFSKDIKIMDYAREVLKMTISDESDSNKLINELEICYLESLWNMLSLRRAILLTEHGQDPFDQLDEKHRVNVPMSDVKIDDALTPEQNEVLIVEKLKKSRQYLNLNNLYNMLDFMYKFIVFKLIPMTNQNKENGGDIENVINPQRTGIVYILNEDFTDQLGNKLEFNLDELNLDNVKLENIHHLWKLLVRIYLEIRN